MSGGEVFWLVRDAAEADAALAAAGRDGANLFFGCTNAATLDRCCLRGAAGLLLEDDLVRDEQRAINRWSYETLIALSRRLEASGQERRRFFVESHFLHLRVILIRAVKYWRVLEKTLASRRLDRVALSASVPVLPKLVLEWMRSEAGGVWEVESARSPVNPAPASAETRAGWGARDAKARVQEGITRFLSARGPADAHRIGASPHRRILASGALGHLADVVEAVRQLDPACEIVFVEPAFNLEKYAYCRRKRMRFCVLPYASRLDNPFAVGDALPAGEIVYAGRDVRVLVGTVLKHLEAIGLLNIGFDLEKTEEWMRALRPSAVVLDEDLAVRRVFSACAKKMGVPRFVVSHGIPLPHLLETEQKPAAEYYDSAETFVQSDFEREAYRRFFYDPDRVRVTGLPRYDRIVSSAGARVVSKRKPGVRTVLYCGIYLRDHDWMDTSVITNFLGNHVYREHLEPPLLDLCRIVLEAGDGVRLNIKPHYRQDAMWERFRQLAPLGERIRLLPHDADIQALEAESDVIVTTPSSVVVEGMLYDKPVILVDYMKDGIGESFVRHGAAMAVHDAESLKTVLKDVLFDETHGRRLALERQKHRRDFAPYADGRSAQRIAGRILERMASRKQTGAA